MLISKYITVLAKYINNKNNINSFSTERKIRFEVFHIDLLHKCVSNFLIKLIIQYVV